MLKQLNIKNYALLNELHLSLSDGLTIITGETGAGKSILLGALRLVLGERADLKSIRNIKEKCIIEAVFNISELHLQPFFEKNDLDYENETILRREILPSGKSRSFVNDVPTTLKTMEELSGYLIDIHSQFETANIITEDFQFEWVDAVAENQALLANYHENLKQFYLHQKEIQSLTQQQTNFFKEKEYIEFLFQELNSLPLHELSLDRLEKELYLLENAEEMAQSLNKASQLISDEPQGILSLLTALQAQAKKFSTFTTEQKLSERIDSVKIELQDILFEVEAKAQDIEPNPERLFIVQQKLNAINALLQKHQMSEVEELILLRNQLEEKLNESYTLREALQKAEKELSLVTENLVNLAERLHKEREKVIPKIQQDILQTLHFLGMPNAEIQLTLSPEENFNQYGKERLIFLFSANKGMPLSTLEKSVSGGERSRLMLAIKKSLAHHKTLPTLILDEIDTGVSGKIAGEMAKIMAEMGKELQVITITHLPQVAAKGNQHLKVVKVEKEQTTSSIKKLGYNERLQEIAQMISGSEVTEAALQQARELLNQ